MVNCERTTAAAAAPLLLPTSDVPFPLLLGLDSLHRVFVCDGRRQRLDGIFNDALQLV